MNVPNCLLLLTVFAAVPATASQEQPRAAIVHYSDLDLTRQRDRDTLNTRINRAARQACARNSFYRTKGELQCRDQAIQAVAPQRAAAIARALQRFETAERPGLLRGARRMASITDN
jgi:UrcA family protein